ncbi:MAG TPA: amidohydrolase family protein [Burkholderiales bacterium]|nr:amidohydrolase family protein [Burkholderiales bacterium]
MSHGRTDRRRFLKQAGLAALAATAGAGVHNSWGDDAVPYSSGTEPPKFQPPPGACDCHMHIYNSRFPVAPTATLRPPDAGPADYRLLQKRIGTSRNVVVQPSTYGTDNSCTLDAVAQIGPSARAVAVVDTSVTDQELQRLASLGVRGIRFNLVQAGATTIDMMGPLSSRVNELGWHVQIHMLADQIAQAEKVLAQLSSPLVIDHMGRIPPSAGVNHPAFEVIAQLVARGHTWVKLSGAYMGTKVGPPSYSDVAPLARAYIRMAPERMVWATDWPHPTEKTDKPDDAILLDLLADWTSDEHTRHRILVENPEALYGFSKSH